MESLLPYAEPVYTISTLRPTGLHYAYWNSARPKPGKIPLPRGKIPPPRERGFRNSLLPRRGIFENPSSKSPKHYKTQHFCDPKIPRQRIKIPPQMERNPSSVGEGISKIPPLVGRDLMLI